MISWSLRAKTDLLAKAGCDQTTISVGWVEEELQAEVDYLKINQLTADAVLTEAKSLYNRWPKLPTDEKRKIAESLCQKISAATKST
jgi:hypothetical protein